MCGGRRMKGNKLKWQIEVVCNSALFIKTSSAEKHSCPGRKKGNKSFYFTMFISCSHPNPSARCIIHKPTKDCGHGQTMLCMEHLCPAGQDHERKPKHFQKPPMHTQNPATGAAFRAQSLLHEPALGKHSKGNTAIFSKTDFGTSSVILQGYFSRSGTEGESCQVTLGIFQRVEPQVFVCILGRDRRNPQICCQARERIHSLELHELSV